MEYSESFRLTQFEGFLEESRNNENDNVASMGSKYQSENEDEAVEVSDRDIELEEREACDSGENDDEMLRKGVAEEIDDTEEDDLVTDEYDLDDSFIDNDSDASEQFESIDDSDSSGHVNLLERNDEESQSLSCSPETKENDENELEGKVIEKRLAAVDQYSDDLGDFKIEDMFAVRLDIPTFVDQIENEWNGHQYTSDTDEDPIDDRIEDGDEDDEERLLIIEQLNKKKVQYTTNLQIDKCNEASHQHDNSLVELGAALSTLDINREYSRKAVNDNEKENYLKVSTEF